MLLVILSAGIRENAYSLPVTCLKLLWSSFKPDT